MRGYRTLTGVCLVCGMWAADFGHGAEALSGLTEKAHIAGPRLQAKDLQGKVVFVEFWGLNCPPCRSSLPHMQELYEKHAKRGNFMLIGSHCQSRDDEKILALLKEAGVTYPVYEYLKIEGMPPFRGIPHAAILDHKGRFVTSGGLGDVLAALPKVLQAAPVPVAGSLLGGMEVEHNKGVEQRLVFGQNIEPVLAQLSGKAKAEHAAGQEAAAIVQAVEAALAERENLIREQLAKEPSQALASIVTYGKTCPSKASRFSADYARLNANPDIRKLAAFRQEIQKMEALKPKTKNAAKSAAQQSAFKRQQYAALGDNPDAGIQAEAQTLLAAFDALVATWNTLAQAAR